MFLLLMLTLFIWVLMHICKGFGLVLVLGDFNEETDLHVFIDLADLLDLPDLVVFFRGLPVRRDLMLMGLRKESSSILMVLADLLSCTDSMIFLLVLCNGWDWLPLPT